MTTYSCSAERFASDTKAHTMTVVRAEGIDRHLRFRQPGHSAYWFDVLTWPGALCIDGDCGTFVFRRLPDMFEFFRNGRGDINPSYWAEKIVSGRGSFSPDGIEEFDPRKFRHEIVRQYREYFRGEERFSDALEGFRDLRADVLDRADDGEQVACQAAYDFEVKGRQVFQDISAHWFTQYTFHFIWCLRAIVLAIQQWDAAQQEKAA